jgi:hypothetical protein
MNIYLQMAELGEHYLRICLGKQPCNLKSDGTFESSKQRVTQHAVVCTPNENQELALPTIVNYDNLYCSGPNIAN